MAQTSMTREACATLCYTFNFFTQAPLIFKEKAGLVGPDPVTSPCAFLDYGVKRLDITPCLHLVETNTAVASACIINQDTCATHLHWPHRSWRSLQPRVISTETRAFNNLNWHRGSGVLQKIRLTDLCLSGEYAAAYVAGCQDGPDKKYKKMAAGLRHVDAHSVETTAWHSTGTFPSLTSGTPRCYRRGHSLPCARTPASTACPRTLSGGADMELGDTCFTTNGNLAQAVQHNRTTINTMHNTVRRASMGARPVDPSLTSSNGPCISECPDGGHELGQRVCALPIALSAGYYAKDHRCVPCHTWCMGTWASAPCSASYDAVCSPWTECRTGPEGVSAPFGMEYQPLPDRASCFPTSVCEEPFIETIPPPLTTDRLCSCDTLTCNKLITQLFEEMVCAEPTDEQLDVVLDVCCSGQGEDGIRNTRQMDAYEARRSCPGCTDTCECSAGFMLVYDADSADCRPCDGVTEFSASIGGSKCEAIEECERGQEEISAPTHYSSDRVRRDCPAGAIDTDSDGSTASPAALAPTTTITTATPPPSCMDVTECAPGFEEVQAMTLLISDRVCDKCLDGTFKAVSGLPGHALPARHHVRRRRGGDGRAHHPDERPRVQPVRAWRHLQARRRPGRVVPPRHADTCVPVSRCAASEYISFGTFQSQVPTLECSECPSGRFEIRACSALEDVQCAGCSACPPNTYILRACDSENDVLPACNPSTEYERTACATSSPSALASSVSARPPPPPTPSASRAPSAPLTTTATRSPPASRVPMATVCLQAPSAPASSSCAWSAPPTWIAATPARRARLAWTLPPSLWSARLHYCGGVQPWLRGDGAPCYAPHHLHRPPVPPLHRGPVLPQQQHGLLHAPQTASARWARICPNNNTFISRPLMPAEPHLLTVDAVPAKQSTSSLRRRWSTTASASPCARASTQSTRCRRPRPRQTASAAPSVEHSTPLPARSRAAGRLRSCWGPSSPLSPPSTRTLRAPLQPIRLWRRHRHGLHRIAVRGRRVLDDSSLWLHGNELKASDAVGSWTTTAYR
ncbi:hypothetical protein PTSG_13083 [Salpingoeca rosetta]|uniref:TNFR-Cys domain-containing protein n=1 Tax=Salpingoeca rosetta (strain ATCC 50818 / BSB-021) TaxID=946362 RepID=F2URZ6_SALR5|nr:uncharacterized protein PTSG_13083 [Salpingoeca rosetta]EGD80401.1 hypothetical protein PTSG_13083 [Salpingoeca rosetta]|eukprot:XP_004988191.1 hypothetical protein PTSG_13083 [Salpingoeca rosetta]